MTIHTDQVIDLTHTIDSAIPSWPTQITKESFSTKTLSTYKGGSFFYRMIHIPEHYGTHIDAPAHGIKGKATVDNISPGKLISSTVVIDVRKKAKTNPDYLLTVDDIILWEKRYAKIQTGSVVLLLTGWGKYWSNKKRYLNQDKEGVMHFPGFSKKSVELLVMKRKINGIGIDTMSIDAGNSSDFTAHSFLFKSDKYALENLANIEKLPPNGATIIIAPLKIKGGSGSPVRVFAMFNKYRSRLKSNIA